MDGFGLADVRTDRQTDRQIDIIIIVIVVLKIFYYNRSVDLLQKKMKKANKNEK